METVRTIRIDPKTLNSVTAQMPLEQLGQVEVRLIEPKSIRRFKPPSKKNAGAIAAIARREGKEKAYWAIVSSLGNCTARQVLDAYLETGGKTSLTTIQNFLKAKVAAGELRCWVHKEIVSNGAIRVNCYSKP